MTEDDLEAGEPDLAAGDKFYRGTIEKLFPGSQMGTIRSGNGREIAFEFAYVNMVGPVRRFEDLSTGMRVGFDVGWTSSGLRVTVIQTG